MLDCERDWGLDWATRYRDSQTPWDLGESHPELEWRIDSGELKPWGEKRAWVPGCGRGHDALALTKAGWIVTGLDLVEELGATVGPTLEAGGGRFLPGDALLCTAEEPVDLIFDHTFFCALPPRRRVEFGGWVSSVLAPKGRVCSLVFPADRPAELGGPPFSMTTADLAMSLGDAFVLLKDENVSRAREGRAWEERWAVFERTE